MSKFANSFDKIYEAVITRATTGCFSAGDVVTFDSKKLKKHEEYEKLTGELKSRLDNMMMSSEKGDAVIVVTDTTLGALNGTKAPTPSTITLAYSHGGGRWIEPITISGALTQFMTAIESGINLVDKIPSVNKIVYPSETKAVEVNLKDLEKNRTKGHASSTLHGESYEPTSDVSFTTGVTIQIAKAIKSWAKGNQKNVDVLTKIFKNQPVLKTHVKINTVNAKDYEQTGEIDSNTLEEIITSLIPQSQSNEILENFEEFLIYNAEQFISLDDTHEWENELRLNDEEIGGYEDTVNYHWYNR